MFMEDGKFQEYYRQIRERDERIANEKSLLNVEGTNVFTIFGLSLGITSIVFSFFTRYSIVFALLALLLSFIGRRKKKNNIADAGVICSTVGLIMGIIFIVFRFAVVKLASGYWRNFLD